MPQLLLGFCFLWLGTLSGQIPNPFFPQLGQGIGVNALAAKGDTLFVAGDFQVLGTTNRQHIGAGGQLPADLAIGKHAGAQGAAGDALTPFIPHPAGAY